MKSVFRQRKVEKIYTVVRKGSYYGSAGTLEISVCTKDVNVISDDEIDSCDIEIPMLEIGEEFFLSDITKTVRIKSRMRSSDGSITYYVEDEFVETENTKSSYEKCMEFVSNYSNRVESEITALRTDFEEYKKKYKYKHRFFNF